MKKPLPDKTYTVDEIRAAYWKQFHEAGEFWFSNLGTSESNTRRTESYWKDFLEGLTKIGKTFWKV